ncbi:MAG: homoserine O-succinyltransferase [Terriglobia bacterium]
MPLVIDGGRIPARWAAKKGLLPEVSNERNIPRARCVRLALINNMPDPALEDTEIQFFELLENAADQVPVSVKLFSLPGVPRGDRGNRHLSEFYHSIEDIWNSRFDGVIITGTEPHQPDLRREPYWQALVNVLDWAERQTSSTVLSCLAAHAGVLHSDGIARHSMWYKMCGVFECKRLCDHALTNLTSDLIQFPHSRWNEVREDDLTSCGYIVLTKSTEAGIDCFVKKKRKSLFVHFQGHPEYEARTLFKEYRRDLRRFLTGERKTYPYVPHGYFDAAATKILAEFREKALSQPREELMADFPEAAVTANLQKTWHAAATSMYGNWLHYLVSRKTDTSAFAAIPRVAFNYMQRKRFATSER